MSAIIKFWGLETLNTNMNERLILNSEGILENAVIYHKKTNSGNTLYSKINSKVFCLFLFKKIHNY